MYFTNVATGVSSVVNATRVGGTGTIAGTVTVDPGGSLAPGAGLGTLTLASSPLLNGSVHVEVDRNGGTPLADQELQHADKIRQMLGRIARNPEFYRPGISFSTVTIRMFAVEMQSLVEQMHRGRISPDRLFAIALEIEGSAVELSYGKLAKTEDAMYNMLAHQIDSESAEHKAAIASKMNVTSPQ